MESLLKNRLSSVLDAKETRSNLGVAVVAKCPPLVLDETKVRQFLQQQYLIIKTTINMKFPESAILTLWRVPNISFDSKLILTNIVFDSPCGTSQYF